MRTWIITALLALCTSGGAQAAPAPGQPIKIGILMFSAESRYQEATRGFMEHLAKAGFAEPRVTFIRENAEANKGKAREAVKRFAAVDLDLVLTLGTSATIAVAREIKNVPIVFSVVYDPVEAGVARDWKSSGNNTTGTSSRIPMEKLLENLKAFKLVTRLAVLYTAGEKNSETQLKNLQEAAAGYGVKIVPVSLSTREEVGLILPEIMRTTEAIYLSGSNLVDSQVALIVQAATRSGVITITHLEDLIEKGVLLGLCPDAYAMGSRAGEKAVRILKGENPASIPIEPSRELHLLLNNRTAGAGQFEIVPSFRARVTRFVN